MDYAQQNLELSSPTAICAQTADFKKVFLS